jgi:hypothetical protein
LVLPHAVGEVRRCRLLGGLVEAQKFLRPGATPYDMLEATEAAAAAVAAATLR